MSYGIGCRHGSDPTLLWLWCRPVATAPIGSLAWEPPYAAGAAPEKAKKQTNKKKIVEVGYTVYGSLIFPCLGWEPEVPRPEPWKEKADERRRHGPAATLTISKPPTGCPAGKAGALCQEAKHAPGPGDKGAEALAGARRGYGLATSDPPGRHQRSHDAVSSSTAPVPVFGVWLHLQSYLNSELCKEGPLGDAITS